MSNSTFIEKESTKGFWQERYEELHEKYNHLLKSKDAPNNIEYIRKDLVDEMLKTAEDHAFFAGRERLREKLLEWAKEQASITEKLNGKGAMLKAWNTLIDKIESL